MPQLDKFSFFTQIFWLFVLFFILYFLLIILILPNLSSLLKIRYKKLFKLKEELIKYTSIELELNKIKTNHIYNILLLSNNSIFHYIFLLNKYNISVNSKIKTYLRFRKKINLKLISEILEKLFGK